MKRHLTANIDFVLSMSDEKLAKIFDAPVSEIRSELLENKAKGHKLIPSDGCEGFCPVNGCPGHRIDF